MMKSVPGLLVVTLGIGASVSPVLAQAGGGNTSVFVMTNDKVKNEVLTYQRGHDGQFVLRESAQPAAAAAAAKPILFSLKAR
jgi:6-phosphogluconolactonase